MQKLLVVFLVGCTPNLWPEPQPARTECSGGAVAYSQGGVGYASGSTECRQLPPDPCYDSPSGECRDAAEERSAHNDGERARAHRNVVIFAVVAVVIAGVAIGVAATQ